jgi:hypothetical protein
VPVSDEIQSDNGQDDDDGAKHFWTTLPGILTGIAALITAVVGAYALFGGDDGNDDATTTGGSNASPSQGDGQGRPSGTAQSSPAPGEATQGEVLLRSGDYVEFDDAVIGSSAYGEILWTGDNLYLYAPRAAIAEAADIAGCETLLTQRKDSIVALADLMAGPTYVCLTTTEDAIVAATIQPPDARRQLPVSWTLSP